MKHRSAALFAGAMLLPVLGLAQAIQRPPMPPLPGPGGTPGAGQPPQGTAPMTAPDGLPQTQFRTQTYEDWLKWYYQIYKIPKKDAIPLGGRRVHPSRLLETVVEIVDEEGDNYLVRNLPPEDPQASGHPAWLRNEK
ncbi:MAG TPA: hypothetical protein VLW17_12910, partial [Thermoanaerobaculaceae bacterium]|nr:hypothetical protein [Thermoanaerobaculaceae bacterium]